jgi:predicted N-acetyltransferase YhbS
MNITYTLEDSLPYQEFIEVLNSSSLGERRPVNDIERIKKMIENADIIITARDNGQLVGIARSISDFSYATYLSDLAVDKQYQKSGIGKELIRHTMKAAPDAKLILLSAPAAVNYYPKIGMTRHEHCYYIQKVEEID